MSSVLRPVRKRKKGRTLGPVKIIRREDYSDLELDAKVELIRSLVPLGLMHVEELLDEEVTALAGERYARKDASVRRAPSWQQSRDGRGWPDSACRCGYRGFVLSRGARCRCGRTRRCMAIARSTTSC